MTDFHLIHWHDRDAAYRDGRYWLAPADGPTIDIRVVERAAQAAGGEWREVWVEEYLGEGSAPAALDDFLAAYTVSEDGLARPATPQAPLPAPAPKTPSPQLPEAVPPQEPGGGSRRLTAESGELTEGGWPRVYTWGDFDGKAFTRLEWRRPEENGIEGYGLDSVAYLLLPPACLGVPDVYRVFARPQEALLEWERLTVTSLVGCDLLETARALGLPAADHEAAARAVLSWLDGTACGPLPVPGEPSWYALRPCEVVI